MRKTILLKIFIIACIASFIGGKTYGQEILYQTGFETSEGFKTSTTYNNSTLKTFGPEGKQWGTLYGTPSTNAAITGEVSLQLRYYDGVTNICATTEFTLDNVTQLTFKAKSTSGNFDLVVQHTTDNGVTWSEGKTYSISTTASDVTYNLTNPTDNVRFKMTWKGTTKSKGVCIDDVVIYGKSSTGPSIKLNPTENTYSFDQTSGSFNYTITNPVAGTNVTATPNNGWITSATANETEGTVSFTMQKNETGADREGTITVKYGDAPEATFTVIQKRELPKYTITWSVNGVTTTETVEEGTALTFAAPTDNIPAGYEFMGWYGSTLEPQNNAPTYVTEATATADATYYAVFAKSNGGTEEKLTQTLAYDTWTYGGSTTNKSDVTNPYRLFHDGGYVESAEFDLSTLTKVIVYGGTYGGESYNKLNIGDDTNTWKDVTVSGSSQTNANTYTEGTPLSGNGKLRITSKSGSGSGSGVRMSKIEIYTKDVSYSDFRTSVTPVETMTIDMTKTYNNDGIYYRTFSSTKAFKVPADLSVSEIAVFDGQLLVDDYKDGDVVAANTGVMLWSLEQKEFTVELSTEAGTVVLGEENMLRPSGDAGITADDMKAKDANCIYYRLTTNKDNVLCYAWGAADGAAFALDANKAYLAVPTETAQGIKAYSFGGNGTTAIDKITDTISAKAERKVYNLQGQRVSGTPAPGLYIVNGKKVVIK